jgi:hypothetical protein
MSRTLREAATRIELGDYKHSPGGGAQYDRDALDVAYAYLAEHPADDDEPISFEWLEAGESEWDTMSSGDHGYYRLHELSYAIYQLDYAMSSNEVWVMFTHRRDFERLATGIKTRGQLRRLIAALKGE